MDKYGRALCRSHQGVGAKLRKQDPTPEAVKLAKALTKRGWRVELEKFDGYKHIDIAITEVKVNIEVDGLPHSVNPKRALADLHRNYYSFLKGYLTLRIPNCLVQDDKTLEHTADCLSEFMRAKDDEDWDDLFDYDGYDDE